ncbi:glutathione S-transferase N-terminal domain-containing protein [Gymnodinialimonas sp. 2305UL16-5]|uniref:glutathione S-transferase N-terminal domain-containing protein n=1 Tax=Gymnodinialimonas mytili TaxID=3126503 RepID=UPI0030A07BCD
MQTLYSMPGACALAPHIALLWSGRPFNLKVLRANENREIEYLRINPLGSVPTLLFPDGQVLTEAHAILAYIHRDNPSVFGCHTSDALRDIRLHQTLSFYTTELHTAFGPHFAPGRYHTDPSEHPTLRIMAYQRMKRLFALVDDRLAHDHRKQSTRSVADAYLYVLCRWLDLTPIKIEQMPNLTAFLHAMEADPAVKDALAAYA